MYVGFPQTQFGSLYEGIPFFLIVSMYSKIQFNVIDFSIAEFISFVLVNLQALLKFVSIGNNRQDQHFSEPASLTAY